jgi:LysM repeat protein
MAYTVKAGDSLWAIAERELGSGARWREIQAANNISGTLIRPGQTLSIPGKAGPTPPPATPPRLPTPAPAPTRVTAPSTQTGASQLPAGPVMGMPVVRNPDGSIGEPVEPRPQDFDRESARLIVRRILEQYGLGSLVDTVMGAITSAESLTEDRLMATIRDTADYKERFRGNEIRRAAGLNVLGEGEYVAVEKAYSDIMRAAGLPQGFYDQPSDFAQLIGGGVSVAELSQRVTVGYRSVAEADPTVREQMRMMYGLTDGELAAYFLDPDRALPIIERQVATARLGAAAARQGFGESVERMAFERMVGLGVTEEQATEVFGTLAGARELLTPLEAGETALDVTDTALGLVGQSPEALQRLRTQQRRRQARFEGGGALATTALGVTGLREA